MVVNFVQWWARGVHMTNQREERRKRKRSEESVHHPSQRHQRERKLRNTA